MPCTNPNVFQIFQSTPSARRATKKRKPSIVTMRISIHALREEGDTATPSGARASIDFNPRPPRGGRQPFGSCPAKAGLISIHALREEGDKSQRSKMCATSNFNPRPPRGGRRNLPERRQKPQDFNPRPPRGGRLRHETLKPHRKAISIHALREEGDAGPRRKETTMTQFQSTPSARRATTPTSRQTPRRSYFNPRPPRGGRPVYSTST